VILYDDQTRSMLQTDQPWPAVSSQTKGLLVNPTVRWTSISDRKLRKARRTTGCKLSRKGWNTLLRLYGPLQPWFDKTWRRERSNFSRKCDSVHGRENRIAAQRGRRQ